MERFVAWFVLLGLILFFLLMRWCFRDWRRAVVGTLVGPMALAFLWFVSFLGVGILLKGLNALLLAFDLQVRSSVYNAVAMATSATVVGVLFVLYCLEQRRQSHLRGGSRFEVPYPVSEPRVNQRRF